MGKGVEQRGSRRHRFGEAYAGERPETLIAEEVDSGDSLNANDKNAPARCSSRWGSRSVSLRPRL